MATSGGGMGNDSRALGPWRDVVQGCFREKVIWTVQLKPSGPKQMPETHCPFHSGVFLPFQTSCASMGNASKQRSR